jgi:hypothetical protein
VSLARTPRCDLANRAKKCQDRRLLQLCVFRLGRDRYGDVGVGVFPEGEEILARGALLSRFLQENHIGIGMPTQYAELLPVR